MSKLNEMLSDLEGMLLTEGKGSEGEVQRLAMNLEGALSSKGWRRAKSSGSSVKLIKKTTPEKKKKESLLAWQLLRKAGLTAERGTGSIEHGKETKPDGVHYYFMHKKHSLLSATIFIPKSNDAVVVSIEDWNK
jgi:hypothetical protein